MDAEGPGGEESAGVLSMQVELPPAMYFLGPDTGSQVVVTPGRIEWGDLVVAQKSDAILREVWDSKEAEGRGGANYPPRSTTPTLSGPSS